MSRIRIFISLIILGIMISSCAPQRKGMRKSRKKDCDCPSFSQISIPNQNNLALINNTEGDAKE
ncbi:MAG: hypothetical protein GQ527_04640 [Bacteroidales bacterium]|nr:hypothetical protein [Bacteroidales bacterium]